MFGGDACTRLPWNISTEPGLPVGATMPLFVAFRNQHQRAVDRHDLVQEYGDIHGASLRHAIVARPGAVVLMPLPDIALECRLGVELELMHVDVLAEQLAQRLDEPRMG